MNIQFSAIAKRKLELLSVQITIISGENTLSNFLNEIEKSLTTISTSSSSNSTLVCENIHISTISEQTSFVYLQHNNTITVLTIFDSRQNPTIVYNDLIEHFS